MTLSQSASRIFDRPSIDDRVLIVHGFGIRLVVREGKLVINDGVGEYRRERALEAVDRTVRRIIITSNDGYMSLSAMRWCKAHRISIITVNPYGELV